MTGNMIEPWRKRREKPQVEQVPVKTVKLCAISDVHNQFTKLEIPNCDLLVVAGDITNVGEYEQIVDFNNWCAGLKGDGVVDEVVCIAGNHDLTAAHDPETWRNLLTDVTYLQDESCEVLGLRIYGSPWTPSFFRQHWVFNADRGEEIQQYWDKIPAGLDVLITHGPPYGGLDRTDYMQRVGCADLTRVIYEKKPRVHVFGHIHSGYGMGMMGNTVLMNAASCTERYKPENKPLVLDLIVQ